MRMKEGGTVVLHITVTAKTAGEMGDIHGFNISRCQRLAELLSDEYRELCRTTAKGITNRRYRISR